MLDLRELAFMDSTGLRVIVAADSRAREQARRLVIVRGTDTVQRIIEMTRLDERLEIVDDLAAVEAGCAPARSGLPVRPLSRPRGTSLLRSWSASPSSRVAPSSSGRPASWMTACADCWSPWEACSISASSACSKPSASPPPPSMTGRCAGSRSSSPATPPMRAASAAAASVSSCS